MIKLEVFTPAIAGKVAPLTINDNHQVTSTLNGMLTAVTNTAQTIAPSAKHNHSEAASTSAIVRDSAIYVSPTILEAPNKKNY